MKDTFCVFARWFLLFAVINGLIFAIESLGFFGGDAFNGKVEDGHYYIANHGHYIEVAQTTWYYSYYHAVSVIATVPLGGVIFALNTRFQNS